MGQYSQTRWSDKLSANDMSQLVPSTTVAHWTQVLASDGKLFRPDWMTQKLQELLVPPPTFVPTLGASSHALLEEARVFAHDYYAWRKESTQKVANLSTSEVQQLFFAPDAGETPPLRLWWEYLQCVGFDRSFYHALASKQAIEGERKGECDGRSTGDEVQGNGRTTVQAQMQGGWW